MKKEKLIRLEVTSTQLRSILNAIQAGGRKGKDKRHHEMVNMLASKYIARVHPKEVKDVQLNIRAAGLVGDLLKTIIHGLSVLSGVPENNITLSTKLSNVNLTAIKKEQFRKYINKYIYDHGSNTFISGAEMNACKTVQDIYDLTLKKLS